MILENCELWFLCTRIYMYNCIPRSPVTLCYWPSWLPAKLMTSRSVGDVEVNEARTTSFSLIISYFPMSHVPFAERKYWAPKCAVVELIFALISSYCTYIRVTVECGEVTARYVRLEIPSNRGDNVRIEFLKKVTARIQIRNGPTWITDMACCIQSKSGIYYSIA